MAATLVLPVRPSVRPSCKVYGAKEPTLVQTFRQCTNVQLNWSEIRVRIRVAQYRRAAAQYVRTGPTYLEFKTIISDGRENAYCFILIVKYRYLQFSNKVRHNRVQIFAVTEDHQKIMPFNSFLSVTTGH